MFLPVQKHKWPKYVIKRYFPSRAGKILFGRFKVKAAEFQSKFANYYITGDFF